MSMGRLMNYVCPDVQKEYHSQLMPLLLGMMGSEEKIKMKAQVVSCAVSFVTNLTGEPGKGQDDIDPEEKEEGKAIITQYSQ